MDFGIELIWIVCELLARGLAAVFRPLWRAYVRVLNLPILAGVWIDSLAGGVFGWEMMHRVGAGDGTWLLGLLLLFMTPVVPILSTLEWLAKIGDEEDEMERLAAGRAADLPKPTREALAPGSAG